ncbi:uncharacterized protein LOC118424302 [Branchiostoma floridae]|uniref:Uncharacterized protein LOC118424302 n=1 Tax=Branchiostoma floridae TaxID=7739 RepID=C3ZNW2_BRAFL|nr:uncharacterized protein LOC118424302 [Branchiostoma floridae]|eukprot:XP_002589686.1 hypothetical protein BRAFLDRAFT_100813 [Branchiostoma floridae]
MADEQPTTSGGGKKKKKLPSKRYANLARRSNEAQGLGKGSRSTSYEPPVGYEVRNYEKSQVMKTPGKTRVRSAAASVDVLEDRGFNKSLVLESSCSENDDISSSEDVEWTPSGPTTSSPSQPAKMNSLTGTSSDTWKTMAPSVFIAYGESLGYLIDQVNDQRRCQTEGCTGVLMPCDVDRAGRGGLMRAEFRCTGICRNAAVAFDASPFTQLQRKNVLGRVVALSFILNGHTYEKYSQVLGLGLGIPVFCDKTYYQILKDAYPKIHAILDKQMTDAREEMKEMDQSEIGSWSRAVTSGDGVYHTRGHHSKNMTVLLVNYQKNSLISAVHLCMRGEDETTSHIELYKGTAKSAEGYGFELIWEELSNEGLKVEVHWQDADSTSARSFRMYYPEADGSKLMYCGGHVGRAHGKQLEKLAAMKIFSAGFQSKHSKYKLDGLKCHCKKHSPTCGCLTPKCIKQMRINHFASLVQSGADPEVYARRMTALGNYHARDVHTWKEGRCDFHGDKRCTCGHCNQPNVTCEGEPYAVRHPLTCPMHTMAYRIECEERASRSKDVIHPEMGRGHSNYPEARNNVLIRYRSKSISLNRLGYCTWTDIGLLQGNMTWCFNKYGPDYHWIREVYQDLGLPVPEGVLERARKRNEERMKRLAAIKTEEAKDRRIALKVARAQDQEERKRWNKRRPIRHSYGEEEGGVEDCDSGDSSADEDNEATNILGTTAMPSQEKKRLTVVSVSRKKCVCGGDDHMRRSNKKCPLYQEPPKQMEARDDSEEDDVSDDSDHVTSEEESEEEDLPRTPPAKKRRNQDAVSRKKCVCGGDDHMRRSSKKCPLYKEPTKQRN